MFLICCDFINFVSDYDIILLTETWNSKITDIHLKGYDHYNCPRPKYNQNSKRNSGGVIVYFKEYFSKRIELLKTDENGIIWFKLKHKDGTSENDMFICLCYIPPEDSAVYRNVRSPMYEFDFFESLNNDIRIYNELGHVYLLGDLNSRTSDSLDYVTDINLDRYVDLPEHVNYASSLPARKNCDKGSNNFGSKLLTLCKENELVIVNGRLEPGNCTYHGIHRNKTVQSTVDYLITGIDSFNTILSMSVLDLSEFSDHCPIAFTLKCTLNPNPEKYQNFEKIIWDTSKTNTLLEMLSFNKNLFDDISARLSTGDYDINQCIDSFSNLVYDMSFKCCGKTFTKKTNNKKKVPWFDDDCRKSKGVFLDAKRKFLSCKSEENKLNFLMKRKAFVKTKRNAKWKFQIKEKKNLSQLSKKSPRKFWKYLNKFKKSSSFNNEVDLQSFLNHFSNVFNDTENQSDVTNNEYAYSDQIKIEQLDCRISVEEVQRTISKLNRYKSCDFQNNVADFFYRCSYIYISIPLLVF